MSSISTSFFQLWTYRPNSSVNFIPCPVLHVETRSQKFPPEREPIGQGIEKQSQSNDPPMMASNDRHPPKKPPQNHEYYNLVGKENHTNSKDIVQPRGNPNNVQFSRSDGTEPICKEYLIILRYLSAFTIWIPSGSCQMNYRLSKSPCVEVTTSCMYPSRIIVFF